MTRALAFVCALACAMACASSSSVVPVVPACMSGGNALADASFDGVRADGNTSAIRFADTACDQPLVVRVVASFCGTCRATAEDDVGAGARIVDVLVRDEDGAPPTAETAKRWQAIARARTDIALDPDLTMVTAGAPLPRVLVIDPRTMTPRADLDDPAPEDVANAVAALGAEIAGKPAPAPAVVARADGRFTRTQARMISAMTMSGGPPGDPTNRFADNPTAAVLGSKLFDDASLSPSGRTSCARCHERQRAFTDGSETATGGAGGGVRNTPSILLAPWSRWQLWDGRADSLWMQALLPLEDPNEFASTRLFLAHRIFDAYREPYEALFGLLPPLDDPDRFPPDGRPGDDAWEAMAAADREAVTAIFVDIGKSLGAYERAFRVAPNALDRYARGETLALTEPQKDGLRAFFETGCAQCHWGGRLTDDAFHPLRFPSGHKDFTPDDGRIAGVVTYGASPFRADGIYSDAKQPRRSTPKAERDRGSFKTPALRGVAVTAPYGHGGNVPSLETAIELHRALGRPAGDRFSSGTVEPWLVPFDASRSAALLAFLQTLGFEF